MNQALKIVKEQGVEYLSDSQLLTILGKQKISSLELKVCQELLKRDYNRKLKKTNLCVTSPSAAREFCFLQLVNEEREVFGLLLLDNNNRLIKFVKLFFGTLAETRIYPQEIARLALKLNAAAAIVTHNHPSGRLQASLEDKKVTKLIVEVLQLVEVRLLDHIIVTETATLSFAEEGLL